MDKIRYIVFLIDSKLKDYDGMVFASLQDAQEWVKDAVKTNYADKFLIGHFVMNDQLRAHIGQIESYGFDKKKKQKPEDLQLFEEYSKNNKVTFSI